MLMVLDQFRFANVRTLEKACEDLRRLAKICEDLRRLAKTCEDLRRLAKACEDLRREPVKGAREEPRENYAGYPSRGPGLAHNICTLINL